MRRVRLGLLLSEIGAANGIEVSQQEMNRLIGQAAAQYQPKDRDAFVRYVQQTPMAAAQLRAPLYEDKVVDFLFSKAEISDRTVTRDVLEADLESEEGHVHGPGCGHDHGEAKPAKKAAAKKPAAEEGRSACQGRRSRPPRKRSQQGERPSQEGKAEAKAAAKKAPAKSRRQEGRRRRRKA